MNISEGFASFLIANEAIAEVTQEIRPILLPDDAAYPAVTFAQENKQDIELLDGDYSDLCQANFVVNTYGKSYSETRGLAEIIRRECQAATQMGDLQARKVEVTVDFDRYETTSKLHGVSQTYAIWYLAGV